MRISSDVPGQGVLVYPALTRRYGTDYLLPLIFHYYPYGFFQGNKETLRFT